MKILHTADWHIGKSLYKHELYEDMSLFFEELEAIIIKEEVEILVVSGDIFDLANPSNKDKEVYYHFLHSMMKIDLKIVITAGNHDSIRMLEGPKDLLKSLNIFIVGDARILEDQILFFEGRGPKKEACVILPVPYLRDRDIRSVQGSESYNDKLQATRAGIVRHFQELKNLAAEKHPNIPTIAMGHIYMQGAHLSDSEREIQIGNEAGIQVSSFENMFDYFALGHIHRPQKLSTDHKIQYSGSPISLSFSERKDEKRVVLIDCTEDGIQEIRTIVLKKYRELIRISGTVDEIIADLISFESSAPLKAYIELQATEAQRDTEKLIQLIDWAGKESEAYKVVNYKIQFDNNENQLNLSKRTETIEELQPIDVFRSKVEESVQDDETKKQLELVFNLLLEEWSGND